MLDFETSKSNLWKITSFSKTLSLQREPFLTMFYSINLSTLLVTKNHFMLISILSNYQQCPLPLSREQFIAMHGKMQQQMYQLMPQNHNLLLNISTQCAQKVSAIKLLLNLNFLPNSTFCIKHTHPLIVDIHWQNVSSFSLKKHQVQWRFNTILTWG